jgi:hypothetical protein
MNNKGVACFLDVYGYSAMAGSESAEAATQSLFKMWREIAKGIEANGKPIYTAFSDSIFLGFHSGEDDPSVLLEKDVIPTIASLLSTAARWGYLLRGSAAYGSFLIDDKVVGGDAIIRAHKNESIIRMPLFCIPRPEVARIQAISEIKIPFQYEILQTRKDGLLQAIWVPPEPIDDWLRLVQNRLREAFEQSNYEVARALKETLDVHARTTSFP